MIETTKRHRRLGTWLMVLLAAACATAAEPKTAVKDPVSSADDRAMSAPEGTVYGISKPSQELRLAFPLAGVVSKVLVKKGDIVKAGDLLAVQDDSQDQIEYKSLAKQAASTAEAEYSVADLKDKENTRDKTERMRSQNVATQTELDSARLAVQLSQARVVLATQETEKKEFDRDKEKDKLDHMQLRSPINGVIRKINIGPGEMADPQSRDGAIVVTAWDPMWIDANPSTDEARELKVGETLKIRFDGDDQDQQAKIIFLDQFDFGSESRLIELEYPNPKLREPGLRVTITLPTKSKR